MQALQSKFTFRREEERSPAAMQGLKTAKTDIFR